MCLGHWDSVRWAGWALWTWEWLKRDLSPNFVGMPLRYLLPFALLGSCSAVVSVFVLSSADTREMRRLAALSVAAGFGFVLVIGKMLEPEWSFEQLGYSAAKQPVESLGPAADDYAEKVVGQASRTRRDTSGLIEGEDGRLDAGRAIADIVETAGRILEGLEEPWQRSDIPGTDIRYGEWVAQSVDAGATRWQQELSLSEAQRVTIEMRPADSDAPQDLMAVLFSVENGVLAKQVAFSDDSDPGSINPRVDRLLEPGTYMVRALPFDDEPLRPFEVRVVLGDRP